MPTLSPETPGGLPAPAGPLTPDAPTLPQLRGEDGRLLIEVAESVARSWREYRDRVRLRGRAAGGVQLTLIESVRQDRRRHLTTFEQRYVERRARKTREHRFELTFRTLAVPQLRNRLESAGFIVDAVLGDYRGRPWDERAEVWIILASRA